MRQSDWNHSYQNNLTTWRDPQPDIERLIKITNISKGRALDLGCGTGEWAIALAKYGFEVEGIDFAADALKVARQEPTSVLWTEWDLENLATYPFKHHKYELIIDQKVLAFIHNKVGYLDTIKERLGGFFVLTLFHKHVEKPAICVSEEEFKTLIPQRFEIYDSKIVSPSSEKTFATYYLK